MGREMKMTNRKTKKLNLDKFCKRVEEQHAYLTTTLGLTDAEISEEASRLIDNYEKDDVVEPSQEVFDAYIAALEANRPPR